MTLRERKGAMLQEPSRIKRIIEGFDLPAALQRDSAFSSMMSLDKGRPENIGLNFLEILTVRTQKFDKVEQEKTGLKKELKVNFEDKRGAKVKNIEKVVCRVHASGGTDLLYGLESKGCINRMKPNRKAETILKVQESVAKANLKGYDEEENEVIYKRTTHSKNVNLCIHPGPSLGVITKEKSLNTLFKNIPTCTSTQGLFFNSFSSTDFKPKPDESIPESQKETQSKGKIGGTIEIPAITQPIFSIPSTNNKKNPFQNFSSSSSSLFQFSSHQFNYPSASLFSSNPDLNQSSNPIKHPSQSINPSEFFQISPASLNKLEAKPGLENQVFEMKQNTKTSQSFNQKIKSEKYAFARPSPDYLFSINKQKKEDLGQNIESFGKCFKGFDHENIEINTVKKIGVFNSHYEGLYADGNKNNRCSEIYSEKANKESDFICGGKTGIQFSEKVENKDKYYGFKKIEGTDYSKRQTIKKDETGFGMENQALFTSYPKPQIIAPFKKDSDILIDSAFPSICQNSNQTPLGIYKAPSTVLSMPPQIVTSDYQFNPFLKVSACKPTSEIIHRFGETRAFQTSSQIQSVLPIPPIQTTPQMQLRVSNTEIGIGSSPSYQNNLWSNSQFIGGSGFNTSAFTPLNYSNESKNLSTGPNMSPMHETNNLLNLKPGCSAPGFYAIKSCLPKFESSYLPKFEASFTPLPFIQNFIEYSKPVSFIYNSTTYPNHPSGSKGAGFSLGIISRRNKKGRRKY